MYFGSLPIAEAEGAYLAHSMRTPSGRIGKGRVLDRALIGELAGQGVEQVIVALLEAGDVHEDAAADEVAAALIGEGVRAADPGTGRVNLQATVNGLCLFDADALIAANGVDEGITMATIAQNSWVLAGRTIATVKIIPYGVDRTQLDAVRTLLKGSAIRVQAPARHSAHLIQTRLPSLREAVLDKTQRVTRERLLKRNASIGGETRCDHTVSALTEALHRALRTSADWIFMAGASAISDRRDVIPTAIVAAGGQVQRFGMAVDPGNLLLLGSVGDVTVVGLPGCARSPKDNGFDRVLDRLACGQEVTGAWLDSLCIGGLLNDITERPRPRRPRSDTENVAALILAAGASRRAGSANKLLHPWKDRPLLGWVVDALRKSRVTRLLAVTGHEHRRVEVVLNEVGVKCIHNPVHDTGMAGSLALGVSMLVECDAIIVCLGDMPHLTADVIDSLLDAFLQTSDRDIFIPTHGGQRGNPVLISREFFDALLKLEGDKGARELVRDHPQRVQEVPVESDGILQDYDTAEALKRLS